jgi:hypothetical protein
VLRLVFAQLAELFFVSTVYFQACDIFSLVSVAASMLYSCVLFTCTLVVVGGVVVVVATAAAVVAGVFNI